MKNRYTVLRHGIGSSLVKVVGIEEGDRAECIERMKSLAAESGPGTVFRAFLPLGIEPWVTAINRNGSVVLA